MKIAHSNVNIAGLHPVMRKYFPEMDQVYRDFGNGYEEAWATSGFDGEHDAEHSKHYCGMALDLRTWTTPSSRVQMNLEQRHKIVHDLYTVLPNAFYIHPEETHIHISFKPSSVREAQEAMA